MVALAMVAPDYCLLPHFATVCRTELYSCTVWLHQTAVLSTLPLYTVQYTPVQFTSIQIVSSPGSCRDVQKPVMIIIMSCHVIITSLEHGWQMDKRNNKQVKVNVNHRSI